MRYERDYHEYYFTADNEVHPTDGGIHLDQPYYTTESYEKFVNNLFAYMMGIIKLILIIIVIYQISIIMNLLVIINILKILKPKDI